MSEDFDPFFDNYPSTMMNFRGDTFEAKVGDMRLQDLDYYTDHPRLYSEGRAVGHELTSKQAFEAMREDDQVRELVDSIRRQGGLLEPILVHSKDFKVIDGNRRLTAYMLLQV